MSGIRFGALKKGGEPLQVPNYEKKLKLEEAPVRIELTHKGFADLSLTAWARRRHLRIIAKNKNLCNRL